MEDNYKIQGTSESFQNVVLVYILSGVNTEQYKITQRESQNTHLKYSLSHQSVNYFIRGDLYILLPKLNSKNTFI